MQTISAETLRNRLKGYADIIVSDDSYYVQVMEAVQELHALLLSIGSVNPNLSADSGTNLKNGYALSPGEAGRCVFDLARTRKFARGIIGAIKEKLSDKKEDPLQIVYAGCGPYAWLALLAVPYFDAADVQFTIIDIHQQSTYSAKNIIEQFDLGKYFKKILTADVLTLTGDDIGRPDIIIIETMKSALQKEPQVSLAAHLVPMLAENGIMIPEDIRVIPAFTEINMRSALQMGEDISAFTGPYSFAYDPIARLDKQTVLAIGENIKKPFGEMTVELNKDFLLNNYVFELQTEVRVWQGELIKDFDSALSLPLLIDTGVNLAGKSNIRFFYLNINMPGFRWDFFKKTGNKQQAIGNPEIIS